MSEWTNRTADKSELPNREDVNVDSIRTVSELWTIENIRTAENVWTDKIATIVNNIKTVDNVSIGKKWWLLGPTYYQNFSEIESL